MVSPYGFHLNFSSEEVGASFHGFEDFVYLFFVNYLLMSLLIFFWLTGWFSFFLLDWWFFSSQFLDALCISELAFGP